MNVLPRSISILFQEVVGMAKSGRSLFDRIRNVKNSLENAEQSFKDNQDMRGELDLMLAEAELKNLRRKNEVPWSWNRHVLAICVAGMVVIGGLVGWYFAMDQYQSANATASQPIETPQIKAPEPKQDIKPEPKSSAENIQTEPEKKDTETSQQVNISKKDMRRLVQSARVELSNSN